MVRSFITVQKVLLKLIQNALGMSSKHCLIFLMFYVCFNETIFI